MAIAAARQLLLLHPDAGGFHLAPGAHATRALDITSVTGNLVGAETCAVVDPRNNGKIEKDLAKIDAHTELHRYVFFMSPKDPGTERRSKLEHPDHTVQVWSVDVE
ncbi:MAG: hypothetical protein HY834_19835 [Devosia nanyangense]|uniref:Uncharacterized protein n=1 Tax=Devosia nanyangense TaxID=1228055 RepID=A0A933P0H4_9HYPH|nr:hypothetical protein [Devosia nanyangense]